MIYLLVGLVVGFVGATVAFRQYLYWWHVGPVLAERRFVKNSPGGRGWPRQPDFELQGSFTGRDRTLAAMGDLIAFEKWQAHKAKVRASRLSWLYPEPPGFVAENRAYDVYQRLIKETRPPRFHQSSRPITEDKTGTED